MQTPTSHEFELPYVKADDTVIEWLSAMTNEAMKSPQPCRKRRLSEASTTAPVKRPCLSSTPEASLQVPLETLPAPKADDIDKILSQLDFSFPPPASIDEGSWHGDMMQLQVIDNTVWQEMQLLPWDFGTLFRFIVLT